MSNNELHVTRNIYSNRIKVYISIQCYNDAPQEKMELKEAL